MVVSIVVEMGVDSNVAVWVGDAVAMVEAMRVDNELEAQAVNKRARIKGSTVFKRSVCRKKLITFVSIGLRLI